MLNFLLLVICVLLFSASDYFAAKWGYERDTRALLVAIVLGPFSYLLFGYLTATTSLSKMGTYVCMGIIICSILAGFFLLGERPNRVTWIGLTIAMLGLIILGFGKVEHVE